MRVRVPPPALPAWLGADPSPVGDCGRLARVAWRLGYASEPPARDKEREPNIGARLDDDGVWILWWGPDLAWSRRTTDPELAGQWDREALGQTMYDGVMDLIDPETARTLARYRSDLPMPGFVYGSDMVMAYEETSAGVP